MRHIPPSSQRTTISLPAELLAGVDRLVRHGLAQSRNQLIASAIEAELRRRERAAIDAEFASMATDVEYQSEIRRLMREFSSADRDTWQALAEEDP